MQPRTFKTALTMLALALGGTLAAAPAAAACPYERGGVRPRAGGAAGRVPRSVIQLAPVDEHPLAVETTAAPGEEGEV